MAKDESSLDVTFPLRKPVTLAAIRTLELPPGSRGLDAGCGSGLQAMLLAEVVGPAGHVAGLDVSPELLAGAEEIVKNAGLTGRISFHEGDVRALPFDDDSFAWAWSMDCVGYAPFAPLPALQELIRVVKPGGSIALLAWSSEKLLPGYPLLEARLSGTAGGIAPFAQGRAPELHFSRTPGWFRTAGLQDLATLTFAGQAYAPLTAELRSALETLLQMRWPGVRAELADAEFAEYQRLCQPGSPDYILNQPDYYAFFTYTMFRATVPARAELTRSL